MSLILLTTNSDNTNSISNDIVDLLEDEVGRGDQGLRGYHITYYADIS